MHKQTTAVNPTGVNKIPHNFHTPCAATFVAIRLLKDSLRAHLNGRSASKGLKKTSHFSKYEYVEFKLKHPPFS
jgi:hypothetical protein